MDMNMNRDTNGNYMDIEKGNDDDECTTNKINRELAILRREMNEIKHSLQVRARDKAFETSYIRLIIIMIITYVLIFIYMKYCLLVKAPELNAIIPTLGFNLSTLSLPCIKRMWTRWMHDQQSLTSDKSSPS